MLWGKKPKQHIPILTLNECFIIALKRVQSQYTIESEDTELDIANKLMNEMIALCGPDTFTKGELGKLFQQCKRMVHLVRNGYGEI